MKFKKSLIFLGMVSIFSSPMTMANTDLINTDSMNGWSSNQPSVSSNNTSLYEPVGYGYSTPSDTFQVNQILNIVNLDTSAAASINIANFVADDAALLYIDGHLIDAVGIFGGAGSPAETFYTPNSVVSNVLFNANGTGGTFDLSGILHNGSNSIVVDVENTGNGIYGPPSLNGNNFDLTLSAAINYSSVPEPTSIALLALGLLGFSSLRKQAAKTETWLLIGR